MVVVRKNLSVEKGECVLCDDVRYFFYLTNDWVSEADEVVSCANDRCDQENLLAQLSGGVRALRAPVDKLVSNWAYMVMTALAWDLKAWWALLLPEAPGRWQEQHRTQKRWVLKLEFKAFVTAFVRIPCQLVGPGGGWCIDCWRGTRTCRSSSAWWTGCAADGAASKSASGCADPRWPPTRSAGRRKTYGKAYNVTRRNCSSRAGQR